MTPFKGKIAQSLGVSFSLLAALSIVIAVVAVLMMQTIQNDFTVALTRTNLALLGAQIRFDSEAMIGLVERYTMQPDASANLQEIRSELRSQRVALDAKIEQAVNMTVADDLTERTQLARIQERVVDLHLQLNRVIDAYEKEGENGAETQQAMQELVQVYHLPLEQDIRLFQEYESSRVQMAQSDALGVVRTALIGWVVAVSLAIGLVIAQMVWSFRAIILPLGILHQGVVQLRRGKLDYPFNVKSGNEIGLLADTLRDMAARLRETMQGLEQNQEAVRRLNAELEQRVHERTAELEAANKELEAFAYSVSHDLRAPLRGIDGYSKLLLDEYGDELDQEAHLYLQNVRRATQRMGQLIDDLLMLSRVTRSEMNRTIVDLSGIAREVFSGMKTRDPARDIEIDIQSGLIGQGDPNLLRILLENLLGNAWKFTSKVQGARIEIGCVLKNQETAYFVRDNGVGFDMKYVGKLFGAFQRLHSPDEYDGSGIGLATVNRIVRRHGGSVWAEGEVGRGAIFYFTLSSFLGETF